MHRKPVTQVSVVLNAATAIVLTINCVFLAEYLSSFILVIEIICANLCWASFAVTLNRYCRGKGNR